MGYKWNGSNSVIMLVNLLLKHIGDFMLYVVNEHFQSIVPLLIFSMLLMYHYDIFCIIKTAFSVIINSFCKFDVWF